MSGTRTVSIGDRLLDGLLAAWVAGPVLAFLPGWIDDRLTFVLYREVKLVVIQGLGWALLAGLWWRHGARLLAGLPGVVRRPPVVLMLLWIAWSATTILRALVPRNGLYELHQHVLLAALTITLVALPAGAVIARRLRAAWVLAVAVATLIGGTQMWCPIPFLTPIDPLSMVQFPSTMGYKNPMALVVVAQLFLLLGWLDEARGRRRIGLAILLAAQIGYLLILQSRTAYAAAAVGAVALSVLSASPAGDRSRRLRRWAVIAGSAMVIVAGTLAVSPAARARLVDAASFLAEPDRYLESDRGLYLRNTLVMVGDHPFGVGLGDWQTHYPVYRRYGRDRWFDDEIQVRRAHSDHVQVLGETGWPGGLLWCGLWGLLIVLSWREAWRRPGARFLAAQVVVFVVAMGSDYVVEQPTSKQHAYLLMAMVLATTATTSRDRTPAPHRPDATSPGARVAPWLVTTSALAGLFYAATVGTRALAAAEVEARYRYWRASAMASPGQSIGKNERAALTALVRRAGDLGGSGHIKTLFRAHLAAAHGAARLGLDDLARRHALRAVRLNPYHPNALRFMAVVLESAGQPDEAARWHEAYEHVMNEATHGFALAHPLDESTR